MRDIRELQASKSIKKVQSILWNFEFCSRFYSGFLCDCKMSYGQIEVQKETLELE